LTGRGQHQRSLLVVVALPLALTSLVFTFAYAVITDAVVAFALVAFLVVLAVFVLLVFVLISMVAMVSSHQNFTRLNRWNNAHG